MSRMERWEALVEGARRLLAEKKVEDKALHETVDEGFFCAEQCALYLPGFELADNEPKPHVLAGYTPEEGALAAAFMEDPGKYVHTKKTAIIKLPRGGGPDYEKGEDRDEDGKLLADRPTREWPDVTVYRETTLEKGRITYLFSVAGDGLPEREFCRVFWNRVYIESDEEIRAHHEKYLKAPDSGVTDPEKSWEEWKEEIFPLYEFLYYFSPADAAPEGRARVLSLVGTILRRTGWNRFLEKRYRLRKRQTRSGWELLQEAEEETSIGRFPMSRTFPALFSPRESISPVIYPTRSGDVRTGATVQYRLFPKSGLQIHIPYDRDFYPDELKAVPAGAHGSPEWLQTAAREIVRQIDPLALQVFGANLFLYQREDGPFPFNPARVCDLLGYAKRGLTSYRDRDIKKVVEKEEALMRLIFEMEVRTEGAEITVTGPLISRTGIETRIRGEGFHETRFFNVTIHDEIAKAIRKNSAPVDFKFLQLDRDKYDKAIRAYIALAVQLRLGRIAHNYQETGTVIRPLKTVLEETGITFDPKRPGRWWEQWEANMGELMKAGLLVDAKPRKGEDALDLGASWEFTFPGNILQVLKGIRAPIQPTPGEKDVTLPGRIISARAGGVSLKALAAAAGVSPGYLTEISQGKKTPTPKKKAAIEGAISSLSGGK